MIINNDKNSFLLLHLIFPLAIYFISILLNIVNTILLITNKIDLQQTITFDSSQQREKLTATQTATVLGVLLLFTRDDSSKLTLKYIIVNDALKQMIYEHLWKEIKKMKVSYWVKLMHPHKMHLSSNAMAIHYNIIMSFAMQILVFKRLTHLGINSYVHKSIKFGGMTLPSLNLTSLKGRHITLFSFLLGHTCDI